jgi:hypothetical protein
MLLGISVIFLTVAYVHPGGCPREHICNEILKSLGYIFLSSSTIEGLLKIMIPFTVELFINLIVFAFLLVFSCGLFAAGVCLFSVGYDGGAGAALLLTMCGSVELILLGVSKKCRMTLVDCTFGIYRPLFC